MRKPTTTSTRASTPASDPAYELGDDGLARWSDVYASAWTGLLETHKRLTRQLDAELEAQYGLEIPVLLVDGKKVAKYRVEERALKRILDERSATAGGAG